MWRLSTWKEFSRYPAIAGVALLAFGVTIAWWAGASISPLFANAEIRRGQVWRLATSTLPHNGVLHLMFNLYWFWIFGTAVERVYGHSRTLLLIMLFAIGSSSFQFALSDGGIGLSGVGYGLFGFLYVLSRHDNRFDGAVDQKTANLFVGWFFFCVLTTITHVYNVANVAHAAGAIFGLILGYAIVLPGWRVPIGASAVALVLFGFLGSTVWRPFINFSAYGGYEEGKWGYDALVANQDQESIRWLCDAVKYQPKIASYWFNLGIAYERLNDPSAARAAYRRAYQLQPSDPKFADAIARLQ